MAHTDNVIGFWDLDSDANDDSGNGHNGSAVGSPTFDGTSVTLDGSSKYVTLDDAIQPASPFTVSIWAMVASAWPGAYRRIFGSSDGSWGRGWGISIGIDNLSSRGGLWVNNYTVGGRAYSDPAGWPTGSFVNLVGTYDSTNVIFYLNGTLISSVSYSTAISYSSTNCRVGWDGGNQKFGGNLRCASIYSVAKDSTWVTEEYNSGTPKKWADWQGGGFTPASYFDRLLRAA